MSSEAQVSVIVPARNAGSTLPGTLEALARQRFDGMYEVIVVDDGSTDGTAAVAARFDGVTILSQAPQGPASARNLGVRHARAALLAFCDADVFPTETWLQAGVQALGRADLVQGQVLPDPRTSLGPFDRTIWVTSIAGLWEAASLFVRRETFDLMGGFEEWIRPRRGKALAEDMWFAYRALRSGARAGFAPEALAHHAVFARGWREYVAERERLRYFPAMARKMPELRRTFLYRHVFLNRRTARLDLALAACGLGLACRSRAWPILAVPYARELWTNSARGSGSPAAAVAVADVAADLVSFAALAWGSGRYRSLVI